MSNLIQENWPQWKPVDTLGSGASGTVYRAVNCELGTGQAAIKVISIPANATEIDIARRQNIPDAKIWDKYTEIKDKCVKEIETMLSLKDSLYVLHLEDYKVVKKADSIGYDILIRMELCQSARTYVKLYPLDQEQTIRMGIDLCRGLEACQNATPPIIHRDIKLQNIFRHPDGIFKLGDFGIARPLSKDDCKPTSGIGTITHIAPEVFHDGNKYDTRADQYSLGLVLYQLMNNGVLPFSENATSNPDIAVAFYKRIEKGVKLPAPVNADPRFSQVILKACSHDPDDRYPTPTAFRQALEALLTGAPLAYTPTPATTAAKPEPVGTFGPKKSKKKGVVTATILLGILLLLLMLWKCSPSPDQPGTPTKTPASTHASSTSPTGSSSSTNSTSPTGSSSSSTNSTSSTNTPDNSPEDNSIPLTLSVPYSVNISEPNRGTWEHWYRFDVSSANSVYLVSCSFEAPSGISSKSVQIYDAYGKVLAENQTVSEKPSISHTFSSAGTYWIKLSGNWLTSYSIQLNAFTMDGGTSKETAVLLSLNTEYTYQLETDGNQDWFKIETGAEKSIYRFYLNSKISDNPIEGTTVLALFDSIGIRKDTLTVQYSKDGSMDLLLDPASIYYVKIYSESTVASSGDYLLCVSQRTGNNIDIQSAQTISLGQQLSSKMDSALPRYYQFVVPETGKYTLTVHNIDIGCQINFSVTRNNSSLSSGWAKNENSGNRSFTVQQGDTLYIELKPQQNTANGTFIFQIERS